MEKNIFSAKSIFVEPFLGDGAEKFLFSRFFYSFLSLGFVLHFGASEKGLGYLGPWDCSPYEHKNTHADQWDPGIAVHNTDMQTKNQECWMIHVYQSFSKPVCQLANNNTAHGTSNAETTPLKAMRERTAMSNAELRLTRALASPGFQSTTNKAQGLWRAHKGSSQRTGQGLWRAH